VVVVIPSLAELERLLPRAWKAEWLEAAVNVDSRDGQIRLPVDLLWQCG
jgi:hypothetical protein